MDFSRVTRSISGHKPWWLDLCSGATATYWGLWVNIVPAQLADQPAFDFLDVIDPRCVGLVVMLFGVSQMGGALLNIYWWRWANALVLFTFYSFVAFGIISSHPAVGVTTYSGWAFANALILVRIYGI